MKKPRPKRKKVPCAFCGKHVPKVPGDYWIYVNEEPGRHDERIHNSCVSDLHDILDSLKDMVKNR